VVDSAGNYLWPLLPMARGALALHPGWRGDIGTARIGLACHAARSKCAPFGPGVMVAWDHPRNLAVQAPCRRPVDLAAVWSVVPAIDAAARRCETRRHAPSKPLSSLRHATAAEVALTRVQQRCQARPSSALRCMRP
jgi:hypothetical protein